MKKIVFSILLFTVIWTVISNKGTVKADQGPNSCNACSGIRSFPKSHSLLAPTRRRWYSPMVAARQPRLLPSFSPLFDTSYRHHPMLFLDQSGHLASYDPWSQWIQPWAHFDSIWDHPIHRQFDRQIDQIFDSMWPQHDYSRHQKSVTDSSPTTSADDQSSPSDDLPKSKSTEQDIRKSISQGNTVPSKKNPNNQDTTAKSQPKSSSVRKQPHSSPSPNQVEILRLEVNSDYAPDEISVKTEGNRVYIHGKNTCECSESCLEREFERSTTLPKGVNAQSLKATLDKQGVLRITGAKSVGSKSTENDLSEVKVEGMGLEGKAQSAKCSEFKRGIKLKKMNKATGEVFAEDDIVNGKDEVQSNSRPVEVGDKNKQENYTDDDDVTIETM